MDDDEFDFSDADLDDLPANTLQQLETTAIRATQQQNDIIVDEEDSAYYGFDDGDEDEVVNLDDDAPHLPSNINNNNHVHGYQTTQPDNGVDNGAMEVEELPRQSQIDVGKLLERIKKVRLHTALSVRLANGCS